MISATLDSNVYVSALEFGGGSARILGMARARMIRVDISEPILSETVGVLRDKFSWAGYRLHFMRLKLLEIANLVKPVRTVSVVTDPDDDRIVECAVEAGSDYIVTNDKALLRVRQYAGIRIVKINEFLET